jgi:hypothetical protein
MAAVLWALLTFVYAPSCGRFSCSYVPSWWPQAQADSEDGCPDSIDAAANDPGWAADRYASIKGDKVTTGVFYDQDGMEHTVTSGTEEISARILALLKSSGKVDMPPVGPHSAEEGPCPGAYSCTVVLPAMLPAGATLTVWWPGMHKQTFVGGG